nr:hypothetical protein [uncultured Bacillus sp.]
MGFLTIGIGLAVAVYFLCEGLRNNKSPDANQEFESLDEDDE